MIYAEPGITQGEEGEKNELTDAADTTNVEQGEDTLSAGVDVVRKDARSLIRKSIGRSQKMIGMPMEAWGRFRERRLAQQLKEPDHPRVIRKIIAMLKNGDIPIERTIQLYEQATKSEEAPWQKVRSLSDMRILQLPAEKTVELWKHLSPDAQNNYEEVKKVTKKLVDGYVETAPTERTELIKTFNHFKQTIENRIRGHRVIEDEFNDQIDRRKKRIFDEHELFLVDANPEVLATFVALSCEQQKAVLGSCRKNKKKNWEAALSDSEAIIVIEILLDFPGVASYDPARDRSTVLKIDGRFTSEERKALWEKAGTPDDYDLTWDTAYTYLVVSNFPQSTAEEIRTLGVDKMKKITAILLAYGEEKVDELWEPDTLQDFSEFERQPDWYWRKCKRWFDRDAIIEFSKNLSPTLRAHLPQEDDGGESFMSPTRPQRPVWNRKGFQGLITGIVEFQERLTHVPDDQCEALFAVLKPSSYYCSIEGQLSNDEIINYHAYISLTTSEHMLTLNELMNVREHFSATQWPQIHAGIEAGHQWELKLPPVQREYESTPLAHLYLYEKAGVPEHQEINTFLQKCQVRSDSYANIYRRNSRTDSTRTIRTPESIQALYMFDDACRTIFASDAVLIAQYLNMNEDERTVIECATSGKLAEIGGESFDLPLVEAIAIAIGHQVRTTEDADQKVLNRFQCLTTEQKKRWLFFEKNIAGINRRSDSATMTTLFDLTTGNQAEEVESFLQTTELTGFNLEATLVMASRPDCAGMFFYIKRGNVKYEEQQPVVEKLIELVDAGLSSHYFLSSADRKRLTYGVGLGDTGNSIAQLLLCDSARLAEVSVIIAERLPAMSFIEILDIDLSEFDDVLKQRIAMAEMGSPLDKDQEHPQHLSDQVQDVLPTWVKQEQLSVAQWIYISKLPPETLRNFHQLAPFRNYRDDFQENPDRLTTRIAIAGHPHCAIVLELLRADENRTDAIFSQSEEQARRFCEKLTPEIMERMRSLPKNLFLRITDAPDFFANPHVDDFMTLDCELRSIFGDAIGSIYDLLIMDPVNDLANIQKLRETCLLSIRPYNLELIAQSATGDMRATIERLLAISTPDHKIELVQVGEQLKELAPEMRWEVLREKGPRIFQWDIMQYRRELVESFGLSHAQVDQLLCETYKRRNDMMPMPEIDLLTAQALLRETGIEMDNKCKRMAIIFQQYRPEFQSLLEEWYSDVDLVVGVASRYWGSLPATCKQNQRFLEMLRDHAPLVLLDHYEECNPAVSFTTDAISTVFTTGHPIQLDKLLGMKTEETTLRQYLGEVSSSWPNGHEQLLASGIILPPAIAGARTVSMAMERNIIGAMIQMNADGLGGLTPEINALFGERLAQSSEDATVQLTALTRTVAAREFERLEEKFSTETIAEITEQNWMAMVMAFIRTTIDDPQLPTVPKKTAEMVVELFKKNEVKDFCLERLQRLWMDYLRGGNPEKSSAQLTLLTTFIDDCEGAGPMSQFEALSLMSHAVRTSLMKPKTSKRTSREVMTELASLEQRFAREHWSNEAKTDFYNISRDILEAAPSLYSDFLEIFTILSPADCKNFSTNLYPLCRAQLAVMPRTKKHRNGEATHQPRQLAEIRQRLRAFARDVKTDKTAFEKLKNDLVAEITKYFRDRFGITSVPEQFTAEHIRSLTNITLYLANIHGRDATKEQILGLYLGLLVNDQWDAFRRGEVEDATAFLSPERASGMTEILQKRKALSPLTAERLGISEADLTEFQLLLQRESASLAVGDIETIDVKLGNVVVNLRGLEDPDLYPDPMDKQRLQLLTDFSNKQVGATAAKLFMQLSRPERAPALNEAESQISGCMMAALQSQGLPLTPENIKIHFQDGMKVLSVVTNVLRSVEELGAEDAIGRLQTMLKPSDAVVAVFTRLGEEFKPTSGAMALAQDLDYLDNIIVKREDELTPEEKLLLTTYIRSIREEVLKLQVIYDQVKAKFENVRSGNITRENELLRAKIDQIENILNSSVIQQSVTSTMTGNLNAIIENIRECLSCKNQGCNNDTDLSFGDDNKFFIYSHTESQRKGSVADQIVFLEPVSFPDGTQEMAFVFDRVYGSCTPFILTNHIAAVAKQYTMIKKRFPECRLSIMVTNAAMSTSGQSETLLQEHLKAQLGKEFTIGHSSAEVDIVPSATGDHYVEFFGGGCRTSGKRAVSGLVIRCNAENATK